MQQLNNTAPVAGRVFSDKIKLGTTISNQKMVVTTHAAAAGPGQGLGRLRQQQNSTKREVASIQPTNIVACIVLNSSPTDETPAIGHFC